MNEVPTLHNYKICIIIFFVIVFFGGCTNKNQETRKVISLNGDWQLTKTALTGELPENYPSQVPVPGVVDLAREKLDSQDTLYDNSLYWHKTTFTLNHDNFDVALLKIKKAKYHTRVYLNGNFIGENPYSYSSTTLDIKPFVKEEGETNDLVISVGCINNLPDTVVTGVDYEKLKYIPGIYDDVDIILTNRPYITSVQVAPNLDEKNVRVAMNLDMSETENPVKISYNIREVKSGKVVAEASYESKLDKANGFDFNIAMDEYTMWTPENPFLYELELGTSADSKKITFGMRKFRAGNTYAQLNNEDYMMRGTNVCIFRFFEDPDRNQLPWDKEWVIKLHKKFKEMHWNSIRYCLGPPPEMWYDVADSLGILIQNEYPVWTGFDGLSKTLPNGGADQLISEYKAWMKDLRNHASVVIWDAQNESINDTTAIAINKVRDFDLSQRPWDNGWAAPASNKLDFIESHPYLFYKFKDNGVFPAEGGILKEILSQAKLPKNDPNERDPADDGSRYENPIIVNEYGWLWLNRDGTTTTLTDYVYANVFPEVSTNQERLYTYSRTLGALTEYWRAHRKCAAIMHFCGLGYSRPKEPRGQTSDNFVDITHLEFEPNFYEYVRPAFSPVGIMLEYWEEEENQGTKLEVPVHIINDNRQDWSGELELLLVDSASTVSLFRQQINVRAGEKIIERPSLELISKAGNYQLIGKIIYKNEPVKSIRNLKIK